jgi:hypothetical protein
MTVEPVDPADLERARMTLIESVNGMLTPEDKAFLVAFKEGNPNWNHLSVPHIRDLPAIKSKQYNPDRLRQSAREAMIDNLRVFFGMEAGRGRLDHEPERP